MQNFKLLHDGIDVLPLLSELEVDPGLWDADTSRQDQIPIHGQTRAIILRSYAEPASADKRHRESFPGCITYVSSRRPVAARFPRICRFVESFARRNHGLLGRVAVVSLRPKGHVLLHFDAGFYYKIRWRYHLVLQSKHGSRMNSGGESVMMRDGQLWWFENREYHEAFNDSDTERIHLIVDMLSPASLVSAAYRFSRSRSARLYRALRRRLG